MPLNKDRLARFIHEHIHEQAKDLLRDLIAQIIEQWEDFKAETFEFSYERILENEGLSDWRIKITSGGGLCLYDKKELWVCEKDMSLFLHEVAHALCPKEKCGICWVETNNGHNAIWGDSFTALVKKYLTQ